MSIYSPVHEWANQNSPLMMILIYRFIFFFFSFFKIRKLISYTSKKRVLTNLKKRQSVINICFY